MLEVSFEENAISAITHCTQWDYGQDMIIKGLYLPERVEIHFALESQKSALIQIGTTRNETTIVRVPDRLLESGENICAYIYIADEEKGRTVRTIRIFVKKRAKPEEYDTPPEDNLLRTLMKEIQGKADNIELNEGFLQLLSGENPVGNKIRLPAGSTGVMKEIELINDGEQIKWRYTDSNEWNTLVFLNDLKGPQGPAGKTPEFELRTGHLFAIYEE